MTLSQLHKPVLLNEVVQVFKEHFNIRQNIFGIDGTFGRGGHYRVLSKEFSDLKVLALDQDLDAIQYAKESFAEEIKRGSLRLAHTNFSETHKIKELFKEELNFVFLDIGVSSPQLDNPQRGFSFYSEGPLDMRMDQTKGQTAAEILNNESLENLRNIFLQYGEVYAPQKLLQKIQNFREEKPFKTTLDLAHLIESSLGWRKKGMHPATLYFQGLRVYINQELENLQEALEFYTKVLAPGGIFVLITFHSLEDRIVKNFFKKSDLGKPVNKKVIKPSEEEVKKNIRARSSKLRVFKKHER